MTEAEISAEISDAMSYLLASTLPEETKDGMRRLLRVSQSGSLKAVVVLHAVASVRDRVREGDRIVAVAKREASAAIARHVAECKAQPKSPMTWKETLMAASVKAPYAVAIVIVAAILRWPIEVIFSLIK